MKTTVIKMANGKEETLYIWDDVLKPKAVLHLVHGSAEYMPRYDDFAKTMNKNNIIVVGNDLRGHGKTADISKHELGYFADKDGWNLLVNDIKQVDDYIKINYSGLKVFMFGHSMGSFLARTYVIKYSESINGLILSGTAKHPKAVLMFAKTLSKIDQIIFGAKHVDKLVWKLSYKQLNNRWKSKTATGSEWQTKDIKIQQDFQKDPLCGFKFTSSGFKDMFSGMLFNNKKKNMLKMRKDLPILIISGEDDPVGNFGKGPIAFNKILNKLGYKTKMVIYPNLRHEILNEPEKNNVEKDILNFITENTKNKKNS